jgi:hypothetical protein
MAPPGNMSFCFWLGDTLEADKLSKTWWEGLAQGNFIDFLLTNEMCPDIRKWLMEWQKSELKVEFWAKINKN